MSKYIIPELYSYLYISHLEDTEGDYRFWHLPQLPDSITDSMTTTFESVNALGRTAPVFTYSSSGPRTVSITLNLLRDLMDEINALSIFGDLDQRSHTLNQKHTPWTYVPAQVDNQNKIIQPDRLYAGNEDYTDKLIKAIQSIAVPKYNLQNNAVEPPLIAIRFGEEVFIKGVVTGSVQVTYTKPILDNGKYNQVQVQFTISEVDPYDATSVFKNGSFRGLTNTLRQGMSFSGSAAGDL